ncbi:MAG: DegT/DnrJ/EryC1/StrS family aminotransferase [Ruminiclostridium sp.]|nr:DegT/DnrJ/EryC1/StrS family aminotransferase [Ruminiclostridium sp.]
MRFRDLRAQYLALKTEIDNSIQSVLDSSDFILGKPVAELEGLLADYVGRRYCVSCSNGTDALQLSLMALDIKKGDVVFTSDFTYFASACSSSILGATVVFVDIDERTFNISPIALEKAIQRCIAEGTLTPKVIVPVDLFGQPADYTKIIPIADKYGLKIIEDGAQGFGGSINGKLACSFGDISTTSFFPAKPLGCYGDGGAIFLDDDIINQRLRSLRALGKSSEDKYDNREFGINSRLDTIQAAILIAKFKPFVEYELDAVNKVAKWYTEQLEKKVITPFVPKDFYSSWAQYTIMFKDTQSRKKVQEALKQSGIPSMIYYPRGLHQQRAYESMCLSSELYPNTIKATQRALSLPMHPYLNKAEVETIAKIITENI